jgi:tRNA uridine 5-carboxymethylaminomethyl modification enzyme
MLLDVTAPPLADAIRFQCGSAQPAHCIVGADFDFASVPGLSAEMVERLSTARPETLDQASRVAGVTPAALSALHVAASRSAA